MSNEGYHEPLNELSDETRDMHRAIVSLMEKLEAVDRCNQRVDACKDEGLKAILAHNRDEEKAFTMKTERRHDMGQGGYCVCPKCDTKTPHRKGIPCQDEQCPECDAKLLREGSHHHKLFLEKKAKRHPSD